MLLMGDEVRRTQNGNNNAYCHNDESTWFDWSLIEKHVDVLRFTKLLLERRLRRNLEADGKAPSLNQLLATAKKGWHGVKLNQPDWGDSSHSIAFSAELPNDKLQFHLILNAFWEPLEFELPLVANGQKHPWKRWIHTALDSPNDIIEWRGSFGIEGFSYRAESKRSVVVLIAELGN